MLIPKQTKDWIRLDNAAMMFPAGTSRRNTRVFRFTCELAEEVDPELLQRALDLAVQTSPGFLYTMRSGLFWHYLERINDKPLIHVEKFTPCAAIYSPHRKRLLFYISYYRRRIHAEFFHALTDGTGALLFTRRLVMIYLRLAHPELADVELPDGGAPLSRQAEDSFRKHYRKGARMVKIKQPRAFQIPGHHTADNFYRIVEGVVSASAVKELAHKYGTTVTGLLGALYIRAVGSTMTAQQKERLPVCISVPVNLRQYFESETMRNFFVTTTVTYSFAGGDGSLEDILRVIAEAFKRNFTKEALAERMDSMGMLERSGAIRPVPLVIKDAAIGISKHANERGETAVLSNVGRVELPEAMRPYVNLFSATSATSNMHLCVITCGDEMSLCFSSSLEECDVPRELLRALTAEGLEVTLTTNYNQS